jgi:hypothetical protein
MEEIKLLAASWGRLDGGGIGLRDTWAKVSGGG